MDVAALKVACDELSLTVKDDKKPTLQEALLSHYHLTNATVDEQTPAAQDLQSFFRLKPASLTALLDSGYDTVEDISLLAQDPNFSDNLDFIPVQQDRLAVLTHLIKVANHQSCLFTRHRLQ